MASGRKRSLWRIRNLIDDENALIALATIANNHQKQCKLAIAINA